MTWNTIENSLDGVRDSKQQTAKVTIRQDQCVIEDTLASDGKMVDTLMQMEKELVVMRGEEQAIVMLYLRNINQTWHCGMVRYLEDTYIMGMDIYPTSLPDVYWFLDDWKMHHRIRGGFTTKGDGVTLACQRWRSGWEA